jgi:FHS family L-fucose permease-like MFS transporter
MEIESASIASAPVRQQTGSLKSIVLLVVAVYFTGGVATVLLDTLVPKFKALFALSYTEVMLVQFSFFLAYLVVSLPAGLLVSRIGYIRSLVTGVLLMALGCGLFAPAAAAGVFGGFLVALFVLASGITIFQVAANPLVAAAGPVASSHSRLTLALAFNSLGTAVGPLIGAAVILAREVAPADPRTLTPALLHSYRQAQAHVVQEPFAVIACVLVMIAALLWALRRRSVAAAPPALVTGTKVALLRKPQVALGALAMFLYVGAEVSLGSILTNYLMLDKTLSLDASTAGRLGAAYWGGALVGRFVGSFILTRIRPGALLGAYALSSATLALLSVASSGTLAGIALIAVGLFNSIMFPVIFSLAIEGLGEDTPKASALMCMAIVGGAIVPLITGKVADAVGLGFAPVVPAVCYLCIAAYGLRAHKRTA